MLKNVFCVSENARTNARSMLGDVPSLVDCTALQRAVFNLLWNKVTRLHHNVFYYCYF